MEDKKKTVFLVVDDSEFMRSIIVRILKKEGFFEIHTADSGNDAIEIFKLAKPDIVFIDINMTDGDGFDFLKKIKSAGKKASCIVVSAIDQKEVTEQAKSLGAADFVHKPFEEERIIQAVDKALGKVEAKNG